jgi:hypothetical protein
VSFVSATNGIVVGNKGLMIRISNGSTSSQNPSNRTFLPLSSIGGSTINIFAVGGKPSIYPAYSSPHPDSKAVTLSSKLGQFWTKQEDRIIYTEVELYILMDIHHLMDIHFDK